MFSKIAARDFSGYEARISQLRKSDPEFLKLCEAYQGIDAKIENVEKHLARLRKEIIRSFLKRRRFLYGKIFSMLK